MKIAKGKDLMFFTALFFAIAIFLVLSYIFQPASILDEDYHLQSVKSIGKIIATRDFGLYFDSNPPLSPILLYIIGLFTKHDLYVYRAIMAIFGFFNLIIFYGICKQEKVDSPYLATLFLFFAPYYILLSVTFHYEMIGLFAGLLALKYFLRFTGNMRDLYLGIIFSFFAIWTVTRLIFVPAGFTLYLVLKELSTEHRLGVKCKMIIKDISVFFLLLLPLALLFIYWGSLIPPLLPHMRPLVVHTIGVNFTQVIFMFMFIGFYFFIYILVNYRNFFRKKYLLVLFSIPFCWIFSPTSQDHYKSLFLGVIARITYGAGVFMPILNIFLFISGAVIVFDLFIRGFKERLFQNKLFYFFISFLAMMISSKYVWERYYLLCLPIVILMVYKTIDFQKLKYYYYWLAAQIVVSSTYFVNKISH